MDNGRLRIERERGCEERGREAVTRERERERL